MELQHGEYMKEVSKETFTSGLIWKTANLVFSRGAAFFISIILARKLEPDSFGLMSIWTVLLSLGNVFVINGMDTLLVQKKDLNGQQRNAAFTGSVLRAGVFYLVFFYLAPYISDFYDTNLLKDLLRVAGIDFFSQCVITIFTADAMRTMNFKKLTIIEITSVIFSGSLSILSVIWFQHWALLLNVILHRMFVALFLLLTSKQKINFTKDLRGILSLTKDGIKIMMNSFCDMATGTLVGLFSMKKWDAASVGYVNRAEKITQTIGVETYNIFSGLLLPTFSSYQGNEHRLKEISRKLIACSCYLMLPLMGGLALCSRELTIILLTEKWLPIVPIIQIQCIYYMMNPLRQLCMNLNYSMGNYEKNNRIEMLRFFLTIFALCIIWFGKQKPIIILSGTISIISIVIALLYVNSLHTSINYSMKEFVQDIFPITIVTATALFPGMLAKAFCWYPVWQIAFSVLTAILLYIGLSYVFKIQTFWYIVHLFEAIVRRKRGYTFIDRI